MELTIFLVLLVPIENDVSQIKVSNAKYHISQDKLKSLEDPRLTFLSVSFRSRAVRKRR
jgi:hypothetical protein